MRLLFSILFLSHFSIYASEYRRPNDVPCDTMVLLNGNVLLGRIYYEDRTLVKYWHCNDAVKTKHEISMFQIKEIRYGSDKHNEPVVEDRSRLNNRGIYWIVSLGIFLVIALVVVLLLI